MKVVKRANVDGMQRIVCYSKFPLPIKKKIQTSNKKNKLIWSFSLSVLYGIPYVKLKSNISEQSEMCNEIETTMHMIV